MISLIIGHKGSGKTKKLISLVNEAVEKSNGNVVCVEKGSMLMYDVNYRARLIDTDQYGILGYNAFYGFLSGICAGNYDVTDVLVDATFKIGGRNFDELVNFMSKINKLSEITKTNFVFTVSCDADELPPALFQICKAAN